MNSPCYNCIDRVIIPNCHSICEKFKKYQDQCRKANDDLRLDQFTSTHQNAWRASWRGKK